MPRSASGDCWCPGPNSGKRGALESQKASQDLSESVKKKLF